MKQWIITTVVIVFALAGCKPKDKPYHYLDTNLKRHYSYLPGSYWVYRDSLTCTEDSFYVNDNYHNDERFQEYTNEVINISILSRPYYNSLDTANIGMELISPNSINFHFGKGWSFEKHLLDIYPLAHYPLSKNDPNHIIIDTGITLSLGANVFKNNARIFSYDSRSTFGALLNDEVGIVKLSIDFPPYKKVWELQRWLINR